MAFWKRTKNDDQGSGGEATLPVPAEARSIPTDHAGLVERSMVHVSTLQAFHSETWHMDEADDASVDLVAGRITWTLPERMVTAPVELLGTWSPADQTFLWGWEHPSAPPGTAVAAAATRDFAIEHGIGQLSTAKVVCPFDDTWPLVAPAVLIGDLQGIYRMETAPGGAWAFLGFGTVSMSARL